MSRDQLGICLVTDVLVEILFQGEDILKIPSNITYYMRLLNSDEPSVDWSYKVDSIKETRPLFLHADPTNVKAIHLTGITEGKASITKNSPYWYYSSRY